MEAESISFPFTGSTVNQKTGDTLMKKFIRLAAVAGFVLAVMPAVPASAQGFFDNPLTQLFGSGDCDGINENAPDADGDGIPNGQDPDYVRPLDGSGRGSGVTSVTGTGVCDGTGPKGSAARGR
jgi:hypothetical protein